MPDAEPSHAEIRGVFKVVRADGRWGVAVEGRMLAFTGSRHEAQVLADSAGAILERPPAPRRFVVRPAEPRSFDPK